MLYKTLIYFLLFTFISCDKSFTVVIDTTRSMLIDLDIIKANLPTAINVPGTDIGEYILVPFNEELGEPVITRTPRDLTSAVNRLYEYGGNTCPENSLTGIEKALEISKPKSNIFVFTDAYAKDVEKKSSIENLCRNTRSQVVIFLTNNCSSPTVSAQVYYDVAKACSGMVFRFDKLNLRQAFKYIKEVIKVEWTDINSYVFSNNQEFSFSVDSFTKTVLIAVSGEYPILVFSPGKNSTSTFEIILETRNTQVIRLVEKKSDLYTVAVTCEGTTSVALYKKSQVPLHIGFSSEQPRSLRETSRRPLPGRTNYLLIEVLETFKLESIAVQAFNDPGKKTLKLEEIPNTNLYLTTAFIEPEKSIRIWFNGYDKETFQKNTGSTESLSPQVTVIDPRWTDPTAEILEGASITIEFGQNTKAACKVVGYPKPSVWWEDENGSTMSTASDGVLLEIPYLYISYVNIDNVMTNFTIYCKCKNPRGEHSQRLDVFVHRPFEFEVLQTPEDQTIEYGSEGKLYCQVSAYPEAETKWFYNDNLVTQSENLEILPEENVLFVKHMTMETVGKYKCEVSNEIDTKTFEAQVSISGIEEPQVAVNKSNIILKIGDWSSIECNIIKGKPLPQLTWQFKSKKDLDFSDLPDGVIMKDGQLKIAAAQIVHSGDFRCNAQNIKGQDSVEVTVTVQQPPKISNSETTTVTVKEEDDVELTCDVIASPAATVHWEMSQDDLIIPFDERHHTDERYTHKFQALVNDSGNYYCIAQNDIGTAKKTVVVNVLVKPYIEAPKPNAITVRVGDNISLPCNVLFGNPVPSTKWEFHALDSTVITLKRSNSSSILHLNNVRYMNEGYYMCIAVNKIGTDSVTIKVKVQ